MATLKEMMDKRSPESQERIKALAAEMRFETELYRIREELDLSQKQIADALGIKQPSVAALERRGNEMKIETLKRYVESMGGKLRLDIELPNGRHVGFNI